MKHFLNGLTSDVDEIVLEVGRTGENGVGGGSNELVPGEDHIMRIVFTL